MLHIHNQWAAFLVTFALFCTTSTYAAESADTIKKRVAGGNAVAGRTKSQLCQGCHGEFGLSSEDLIPHLAGQDELYIEKQVRNFQSGARTHQIMSAMAKTVSDAELVDIAAYFASQKRMQGDGKAVNTVGKNLFMKGDAARGIPPCIGCHGENGKGKARNIVAYPVLGGQHKSYLRGQLINWRSGARTNSPDGLMNKVAKSLTDPEIDGLTEYLSGL